LQEGPPEKKPRKGRKSKAEKATEEVEAIQKRKGEIQSRAKASAPFVAELVAWPFDIVAARRGPFWKLGDDEKQRLAYCIAMVMEKWLPDFMLKYEEEIALGAVLTGVVIGRVRVDRRVHPRVERPRDNGTAEKREDDASTSYPHTATG